MLITTILECLCCIALVVAFCFEPKFVVLENKIVKYWRDRK